MATPEAAEESPSYIAQPRLGLYALALLFLLACLALVLGKGIRFDTESDRAWVVHIQRALDDAEFTPLDDSTVILLHRTRCYGRCPEYYLRLFGSGRVEFDGRHYVCEFGARTAVANPREIHRLVSAMVAAGYVGYSWAEGPYAMDHAAANTSLTHQGRHFEIQHDLGDQGAPLWLKKMEEEVDRVAGTSRWLPVEGPNWQPLCRTPDGGMRGAD